MELDKAKDDKYDAVKATKWKDKIKNSSVEDEIKLLSKEEKVELKSYTIYDKIRLGNYIYDPVTQKTTYLGVNPSFAQATSSYEIEIVDTSIIDGGIVVYVRAWKDGIQVGFGADGTVEIERIRVFNPPVLIPDPNGLIVRSEYNEEFNVTIERKLTEDPEAAIQQSVGHTVSLIAKDGLSIIPGKIGNTTTTVNPDPSTTGTTADGFGTSGYGATMSIAHNTSTGDGFATEANTTQMYVRSLKNVSGYYLSRIGMTYDTSAVGSDTISSSTLSLYGDSWAYANTHSSTIEIVDFNPAANNDFQTTDFGNFSFTSFSSIAQASISQSAYNDFSLDSNGIANINGSGVTGFGVIFGTDLNVTEHSTGDNVMNFLPVDATGTATDPKLVIEHGAGGTPVPTLSLLGVG